jgi:hypothetical protein
VVRGPLLEREMVCYGVLAVQAHVTYPMYILVLVVIIWLFWREAHGPSHYFWFKGRRGNGQAASLPALCGTWEWTRKRIHNLRFSGSIAPQLWNTRVYEYSVSFPLGGSFSTCAS